MKVAIVGSRDFPDLELVRQYVRNLPPDTEVVSGGADGVDTAAADEGRKLGLKVTEFLPNSRLYGIKIALFVRNRQIARYVDRAAAFWRGYSTGTLDAMECFQRENKPYILVRRD